MPRRAPAQRPQKSRRGGPRGGNFREFWGGARHPETRPRGKIPGGGNFNNMLIWWGLLGFLLPVFPRGLFWAIFGPPEGGPPGAPRGPDLAGILGSRFTGPPLPLASPACQQTPFSCTSRDPSSHRFARPKPETQPKKTKIRM